MGWKLERREDLKAWTDPACKGIGQTRKDRQWGRGLSSNWSWWLISTAIVTGFGISKETPGAVERLFPERLIWKGKAYPECEQHHPMHWGQRWNKKEEEHGGTWLSLFRSWLSVQCDWLPHAPTAMMVYTPLTKVKASLCKFFHQVFWDSKEKSAPSWVIATTSLAS